MHLAGLEGGETRKQQQDVRVGGQPGLQYGILSQNNQLMDHHQQQMIHESCCEGP